MLADVEHRQDVRVIERRGCAGLLLETVQAVGVQGIRRGEHFDRHIAAQPRIARPVDLSHAPGANGADDFVRSEMDARGKGHAREDYTGISRTSTGGKRRWCASLSAAVGPSVHLSAGAGPAYPFVDFSSPPRMARSQAPPIVWTGVEGLSG